VKPRYGTKPLLVKYVEDCAGIFVNGKEVAGKRVFVKPLEPKEQRAFAELYRNTLKLLNKL